eukprot:gene18420-37342_t
MALFDIEQIAQSLSAARREWRDAHNRAQDAGEREFPSRDALAQVVHQLKGALFPMRLGPYDLRQESEDFYVAHTLDSALHALHVQIGLELRYSARRQALDGADVEAQARRSAQAFAQSLPAIRRLLDSDVLAAYQGDPAARSVDEVLLCYPGILAMIHHRLAHRLYQLGLPLLARIVAELAHSETGIDIPPGAQIGAGFFIDHGTGVGRCVGDVVHHAGREARVLERLDGQLVGARAVLAAFQDHGVAAGQRHADGAHGQDDGRIPRRDAEHHTGRLANAHGQRSGHVGRDHFAGHLRGERGGLANHAGGQHHVE